MLGDNLPTPDKVVALCKSNNINNIRLFNPNQDALNALHDSGLGVILGTLNEDLPRLATDRSFADSWVQTNVLPHASAVNFRYITAGNEVIPSDLANSVLPAMQNLDAALTDVNLQLPVTTAVALSVLGPTSVPSQGAFSDAAAPIMVPIVSFLSEKKFPLLLNVYPYFAYTSDPSNIRLDFALGSANETVVIDNSYGYSSLFDAMVDTVYYALEKAGAASVGIVVSETGWSSGGGGFGANVDSASAYNNNAVAHAKEKRGTPKRPGIELETYLFALFNENQKAQGGEQNFGLFYPSMTPVYHVAF